MELDVEFRAEVVAYIEKGYTSLSHHKVAFIEREKSVKELTRQLIANEISDEEFLENISDLFIHKNWFNLVKAAVAAIDGRNTSSEEP